MKQSSRAVQLAGFTDESINDALLALTQLELQIATLPAPLVAQFLDLTDEQATAFLALGALGVPGS